MADTFDSEEKMNQEKFEENDEESSDEEDNLVTQICKLQQIKTYFGDFTKTHDVVEYDAKDMIQKLETHLFINYDTTFLIDYYNVLNNNNADVIKQIDNTILSSIQQAVRRPRGDEKPFEESEAILMAAWLSVAVLCGMRSALAARTLQALLAVVGDETIELIARMWQKTATAEALLELADVARLPVALSATSTSLTDMLLRGALDKMAAASGGEATQERGKPHAHEVARVLDTWRSDQPLGAIFRLAGRVLTDKLSDTLMASIQRAARAGARRVSYERKLEQDSIPSTYQLLFGKKQVLPLLDNRGRKGKRGRPPKRKQELDEKLITSNKVKVGNLVYEDCNRKRVVITLLKEDVQNVMEHLKRAQKPDLL